MGYKQGFYFFEDFWRVIDMLPKKSQLKVLRLVILYALYGGESEQFCNEFGCDLDSFLNQNRTKIEPKSNQNRTNFVSKKELNVIQYLVNIINRNEAKFKQRREGKTVKNQRVSDGANLVRGDGANLVRGDGANLVRGDGANLVRGDGANLVNLHSISKSISTSKRKLLNSNNPQTPFAGAAVAVDEFFSQENFLNYLGAIAEALSLDIFDCEEYAKTIRGEWRARAIAGELCADEMTVTHLQNAIRIKAQAAEKAAQQKELHMARLTKAKGSPTRLEQREKASGLLIAEAAKRIKCLVADVASPANEPPPNLTPF